MTSLRPALPFALGLAGLVPFWALAVLRVAGLDLAGRPGFVTLALATYAATILSFLGGIRWGLAVADRLSPLHYGLGVMPQLIGWAALALPDRWSFAVLGVVILVLGPADRTLARQGRVPEWFGRLRMILSLGAGAALFLAALA